MKEFIHMADGGIVRAEVNGISLDRQRGYALLIVNTGNLRRSLMESAEIEVVKRPDGSWQEVK